MSAQAYVGLLLLSNFVRLPPGLLSSSAVRSSADVHFSPSQAEQAAAITAATVKSWRRAVEDVEGRGGALVDEEARSSTGEGGETHTHRHARERERDAQGGLRVGMKAPR